MSSNLTNRKIGIGLTGSYCTFAKVFKVMEEIKEAGAEITTIFSDHAAKTDTRFGEAAYFLEKAEAISGKKPVLTIPEAEPIGPKGLLDILLIAPCCGNTLSKLANGITDTPVLMAAKAHLRNNKPLVIFLSTNDALGMNLKNIGQLLNVKNIYFVPFGQDNYIQKPNSMISYADLIMDTLDHALEGKQIQPIVISPHHV